MGTKFLDSNEKAPAMGVARASNVHQTATKGDTMNNSTRLTVAPTSAAPAMSSREIAEITGKRHANVLRDIRDMLIQLYPDNSDLSYQEIQGVSVEECPQTKRAQAILLDREHAECLVTGYNALLRMKVIRRLRELEQQVSQPQVPQSMAEALRLAADQAERIEQQERALREAAPKVAALDRISTASGSLCITDAAKQLQIRPKDLFGWMQAHGWIYKRFGSTSWIGYQQRIQQGLLEHKVNAIPAGDGQDRQVTQVRVTTKGLTKLAEQLGGEAA